MKAFRFAIILAVMAVAAAIALAHSQGNAGTASAQSILRIVEPKTNARLAQTFVNVQYELSNPGATGGSPNFRLQLDQQDAVTTTARSYNFTGLATGPHKLSIDVVDGNNVPVAGGHAELEFIIVSPAGDQRGALQLPQSDGTAPQATADAMLPAASSSLPLLSVIGFGVLVGGIASAMKTR
jgi:hypothetical protein